MLNVTEVMVEEWLRNPVTEAVQLILNEAADHALKARADIFVPGKPYETQERIARNTGKLDALLEYQPLFDRDFLLSEVEDLERVQRDQA